jgi:uncharacterized membrane protein
MSRAKANEILSLWKAGAQAYPESIITLALYVTGDLEDLL